MSNWLAIDWLRDAMDAMSATQLAIVSSAVLVAVTWIGIILIKPIFFFWVKRQDGSNDLVSYASAGFSLFYGLLLGLLAVAAFQNIATVQAAVDHEAGAAVALYNAVDPLPEPLRGDLRGQVRDYLLYVINKDWPAHRDKMIWNGGNLRLDRINQELVAFEPDGRAQELAQEQALQASRDLADSRSDRLVGVNVAIPPVLWYVVIVGALLNILLIWLLDTRFMLHLLLGGIISFFLGVMIFLLAAMDRPLQGAVAVSSDAYAQAYDRVMKWDEAR
jgi:hypothetical protein